MSHELRTPLTTVMGYTDLLLAGVSTQLTQQSQTYVERIRTAAWHLLGLIEQILIYARLEVGRERVHVEKVQISRMLRDAAELIEPVASEKGLEFRILEPPEDVQVETDSTKLRQILLNLLSNAVKFTESGRVELEARLTEDGVAFMVHDTGVGIAPEHQQRVFDSFWQVDQSATRKEGGTGIGLSVSRKLARLLGGDITVSSTLQEGTTFTLILPRVPLTKHVA
jgi:signal transduction histidine kinase